MRADTKAFSFTSQLLSLFPGWPVLKIAVYQIIKVVGLGFMMALSTRQGGVGNFQGLALVLFLLEGGTQLNHSIGVEDGRL